MKLPNREQAFVPKAKITAYLLSLAHEDGHGKAKFFTQFGFQVEEWQTLASALQRHAVDHEVTKVEESPFGKRYVIEGAMAAPGGRSPFVRSVWFVRSGEQIPRFVTAYPLPRSRG
ncbi:MAG TPA: hypothetical protein VF177_15705 [Anaerolineae bacterium]